MKKIICFTLVFAAMWLSIASAENLNIPKYNHVQRLELSADATDVDLDSDFKGMYIYQVDIITSLDNTVVLSLKTEDGVPVGSTITLTSATSGSSTKGINFYVENSVNYTLSGLGSGTIIIVIKGVN